MNTLNFESVILEVLSMKKLFINLTLLAAAASFNPLHAQDLERRLPQEVNDSDNRIHKAIQRIAVIGLMEKSSLPVFDDDQIGENGQPLAGASRKGSVAGIYMNEVTGASATVSKDPVSSESRYSSPRVYCNRVSAINTAEKSAVYACSLSLSIITVNMNDYTIDGAGSGYDPGHSSFLNFTVKMTADREDTSYTSKIVSEFVKRGFAG